MKNVSKSEKLFIKGFLVFILFYYSAYFQLIPIYLFHIDTKSISEATKVLLSTYSSVIMAFILYFIYRKDLKKELSIFLKDPMENLDNGFRYYGIGLVVMFISNIIITFLLKGGGASNEQEVQNMIQALPWVMILDACILAPINEEIVFRKTLKDVFKNRVVFTILSFLLFGGAHVFRPGATFLDYLYIIPYGALGAAFAMAYSKTDTVFTSMAIHMIHNTVLVILSIGLL